MPGLETVLALVVVSLAGLVGTRVSGNSDLRGGVPGCRSEDMSRSFAWLQSK